VREPPQQIFIAKAVFLSIVRAMNSHRLVAHRGDNTNYPENSYAGIEAALMAGAKYIEFDIQMNADESLVVIHDTNLKRTANLDKSLFELSDETLKAISVHEPRRFAEQHYPTYVPHLQEILHLLKRYPQAQAFVEIKVESLKHWGLEKVMDKLIHQLKDYAPQVTIISFSEKALSYAKQHSHLRLGYVFRKYREKTRVKVTNLQPDFLICSKVIVPSQGLWQGNWQWMIYSINKVKKMQILLQREDIQLFETDNIQLMLNA